VLEARLWTPWSLGVGWRIASLEGLIMSIGMGKGRLHRMRRGHSTRASGTTATGQVACSVTAIATEPNSIRLTLPL